MRDFRRLECWRTGMRIVKIVYTLVKKLPQEEQFGLSLQMKKSVISMPSNIAEGCGRSTNKDTAHFFDISIGSAFELETQFLAGYLIGYFNDIDKETLLPLLHTFQKKTSTYRRTLV